MISEIMLNRVCRFRHWRIPLGFLLLAPIYGQIDQMSLLNSERLLRLGDRLVYQVIEDREEPKILFVNDRGVVVLPLLGEVEAEGKTCHALAFEIKKQLEADYYYRATVVLELQASADYRGRVSVLGAVRFPKEILLARGDGLTVSGAISQAGGFSQNADQSRVNLIRKDRHNPDNELKYEIDFREIYEKGSFENDLVLEADDLILAHRLDTSTDRYYIWGKGIIRPGQYVIPPDGDFRVSDAILMAGGFNEFANKAKVELIRGKEELQQSERTQYVNMVDILEKGLRDADPIVQADDIIRVRERWFGIR